MKETRLPQRKIIHIDMDCFYAAIEMRRDPGLRNKPMAVGGSAQSRGVLATSNYEARRYGVRSAMSSAQAQKLCPSLIIIPPHFSDYRDEGYKIREIFYRYTEKVEPLSLDEAYLDVTGSMECEGSATKLAEKIRQEIYDETQLTASAGVAPNKFLAKVASDWKKPNGLMVVPPPRVAEFVKSLPVKKIPGVGRVTAERMSRLDIKTCGDLQRYQRFELMQLFGKWGERLYSVCRGVDEREVSNERVRKSLSVERTFSTDLPDVESCLERLKPVYEEFLKRLDQTDPEELIPRSLFVKMKFFDFQSTTIERSDFKKIEYPLFLDLCEKAFKRHEKPVRLLGLGVRFQEQGEDPQLSLPLS